MKGKPLSLIIFTSDDIRVPYYSRLFTTIACVGGPVPNDESRRINEKCDPKFAKTGPSWENFISMSIKSDYYDYQSPSYPEDTSAFDYGFIGIAPTGLLGIKKSYMIAGIGRNGTIAATRAWVKGYRRGIFKYVGPYSGQVNLVELASDSPDSFESLFF
jgi:hypothetical protein